MFRSITRPFHSTVTALGRARWPYYEVHVKVTDPERQDPDYFNKRAASLPIDENYIDNLKKLWNEKLSNERDLMMRASDKLIGKTPGDYGLPPMDPLRPRLDYAEVEELKNAPESVKKIFSVEYGVRSDYTKACKKDFIDLVKSHRYEKNSLQIKIAWATVQIRQWTALVEDLMSRNPKKPSWLNNRILLMINYRQKMLRFLREQNYDEFCRILNDLNISYQIPKQPEHVKTRKAWSEHVLRQRVDAEKERRLEELRAKLEESSVERLAELDNQLKQLDEQKKKIANQIEDLQRLENRTPVGTFDVYEPKLVEEFLVYSEHIDLFYHPPPLHQSH
ncbi:Fimbrin [Aphelenchoides besseyi]|nr:Fimbrin [Aphelenchoides besseyi]KAI6207489.1 Fimbrin [Aphelenchoides besseyi]